MRWIAFAIVALSLVSTAFSAEWITKTVVDTPVSSKGKVYSTIPAGTAVIAECFGAICYTDWEGQEAEFDGTGMMTVVGGEAVPLAEAFYYQLEAIQNGGALAQNAIVAWGDSLTLGQNVGDGNDYPSQAAQLFGGDIEVSNQGIGGQTSTQVAARSGAPLEVTVLGDTIPATGAAIIVTKTVNLLMGGGKNVGSIEGTLCGVKGTMVTDSGGNWTFTRLQDGNEAACSGAQEFESALAAEMRSRVNWFWMGRNLADNGHDVVSDTKRAVSALGHDRYLVGGQFAGRGGKSAMFDELNRVLKETYGTRFVDVAAALVAAGGDGSAGDTEDLRKGFIPRSYFQGDGVHLTAIGYSIVAKAFFDATIANEMIQVAAE